MSDHSPDCDTQDLNPDGIRKPCNCGAQSSLRASVGSAPLWMSRAVDKILAGVDHRAVRWHGPDAKGVWCWQYRGRAELLAILMEEMASVFEVGSAPTEKLPYPDSPEGHDAAMLADEAAETMANLPLVTPNKEMRDA